MGDRLVLVSMSPSNFMEKARWALQLVGFPFIEEGHAPIFHRFRTTPLGGKSVPLLYFPESKRVLTSSNEILEFCAKTAPSLYAAPEAKELEQRFDTDFGPHTRRSGYFFVFKDTLLTRWLIAGLVSSRFERIITTVLFPIVRLLLVRIMDVNEAEVRHSLDKVEHIVAEVNQVRGDAPVGTKFLAGDSFSAADLTFCAHMSLLVALGEHVFMRPLPALGDPALRARIKTI